MQKVYVVFSYFDTFDNYAEINGVFMDKHKAEECKARVELEMEDDNYSYTKIEEDFLT